ncbi:putative subtilisin-like serine protease pr1a protein [Eutypa lata UCREL1]|uniref:Putative subtilisin-like serine protease pr1a protein n=1 Tax=Eutypa lata (strain UCR-EL1) TaxID=1287681 RepID=M7SCK6_EUTLA|nr:putative subtilisin-like serine protease pr1a protein [Eutypa lata UCREL1]
MRSASILATLPLAALAAPSIQARAPLHIPRTTELVEGKYIVKMKSRADVSTMTALNVAPERVFKKFGGFAASLTPEMVEELRNHSDVAYIEQDAIVRVSATSQSNAPWGLARLSNTEPGSTTYTYDESAGEGTCAFVIDTGIDTTHPLENFSGDGEDTDGAFHGTHVAGTIGSAAYGVAKKTSLFAVKVLDSQGQGTNSGVLQGMDYVAEQATEQDCPNGIVVNMSLGGGKSAAVNEGAAVMVDAGLFVAIAAGNGDAFGNRQDISTVSPASEPSVCTVGATDKSDAVASFSNYGDLLDVYAPGVGVLSTIPGGDTDTYDGTSMATPSHRWPRRLPPWHWRCDRGWHVRNGEA